jgi:hypothetical protein
MSYYEEFMSPENLLWQDFCLQLADNSSCGGASHTAEAAEYLLDAMDFNVGECLEHLSLLGGDCDCSILSLGGTNSDATTNDFNEVEDQEEEI